MSYLIVPSDSPAFFQWQSLNGSSLCARSSCSPSHLKNIFGGLRTTINLDKSRIYFFNTPTITQRNISRILDFSISSLPTKNIRAPLTESAIKHSSWREILDKLDQNLTSWTFRLLKIAGHLVLIKVVLQSMPLYIFYLCVALKLVLKYIRKI